MLKLCLVFSIFYLISTSSDIILKPIKQGRYNVALIFIPDVELPPERYILLTEQIQTVSLNSLWIAIPSFVDNFPLEQLRPKVIDEMITKLHTSGMPINNATIFLSGHGLGGIASQILARKHLNKIFGQILIGSYLERKYRSSTEIYPISTLTLSGELDGLTRVTRIIEAFYFYSTYPHFTLIIPGMNHMNVASGKPPNRIIRNDISSEINETIAHQQLAILICDYMNMLLNNQTTTSLLEYNFDRTKLFSQPYFDASKLEGSYHFLPPCYNQTNQQCQLGSAWSPYAQKIMSGLNDTVQMNISDEFHIVYKTPEHFAHLDNNCSNMKPLNNCILNIHTVTQNVYDDSDTGETPTAANEMRVKLISRQVLLQARDGRKYDFNQTDNQSLCGLINQYALNWALNNTETQTRQRYEKVGKKIIIGDDIGPLNAGPLWIWTPLVRI